jgi:hypothetical protein
MTSLDQLQLSAGEEILYSVLNTKGIFRKKLTGRIILTNLKLVADEYELPLSEVNDVVILNRHRTSQAHYTSYNIRSGGHVRTGTGAGNINSKGFTIGDLIVISHNRTDIILRNISDCEGLRNLILSLCKSLNQGR